jgi:exosortase
VRSIVNPVKTGCLVSSNRISLPAYVIIAGLVVLLAYPALEWLVRSWLNSPYYAHGFLVPPIAALLAWRQWRQVVTQPRQSGTSIGILITVVSLAAIVWAMRWQNYFGVSLAFVALLCGILLYLEGWKRLRYWLFPLLFLFLMVPLPFVDLASPWLESFTAKTATGLVRLIGISAVQQGGEITLPNTSITVGAPCSGLRSLVAMVTLGVGWVYLVEGRLFAKALMLLAILPLVAFSNVLRIAILLGVAAALGEEVALSYYHDWSSPILFLLAVSLLLLIGSLLGCSRVRDDIF